MPADIRIPVIVVTGFLGSGKTTLIRRLLAQPAWRDTAVIVNESGSLAIDHHLLRVVADEIRVLEGGCICCSLRGDLSRTLRELFMQALQRQVPRFERVLIETTGLADPAPILFTLRHDEFLKSRFVYGGTLATVDAQHALSTQTARPEWARQLALADRVVPSKTDLLAPPALAQWRDALARRLPGLPLASADPVSALTGDAAALAIDPDQLGPYGGAAADDTADSLRARGWLSGLMPAEPHAGSLRGPHAGLRVIVVPAPRPLSAGRFLAGLAAWQDRHAPALLRLKAVLRWSGQSKLAVLHGVHTQRYPLADLPDAADIQTGVVVVAAGSAAAGQMEHELRALLAHARAD